MLKIKSYITAKFKISKVIVFMVLTIAAYAQDSTERDFSIITESYVIEEFVQTLHDILLKDCIKTCVLLILCKSLNYNSNTKECQLSDKEIGNSALIGKTKDWLHLQSDPYRQHQGETCVLNDPCSKHEYCISKDVLPYFECIANPCKNSGKHLITKNGLKCNCQAYISGNYCEYIQSIKFLTKTTHQTIHNIPAVTVKELTVCMWFNYQDGVATQPHMLGIYNEGCTAVQIIVSLKEDNRLVFLLQRDGKNTNFESRETIVAGKTYHACFLWKYQNVKMIYLNGVRTSEKVVKSSEVTEYTITKFLIGQDADDNCAKNDINQSFVGSIGLLQVWSKCWDENTMQDIYEGIFPKEHLIGAWDMFWNFEENDEIEKSELART